MIEPVQFASVVAPARALVETALPALESVPRPAPAIERGPTVEVVLLTRDSEAELADSLASTREAAFAAGASLLFVDLGSADDTRAVAARYAPGARAVWLSREDSLTDALVVAANVSTAEVLVVLTPTVEPASPDTIAQLVKHLDEHPYAAVAAPAIRALTGELLPSARPEPRPRDYSRVEWVLDSAFAIRRSDLDAIARHHDRRDHAVGDLQLCLELRRSGREVHYVRSTELIDSGGCLGDGLNGRLHGIAPRGWRLLFRHPRYAIRLAGRRPALRRGAHLLARTVDIGVAGALLLLLAPLLIAIAIAIRLDSRGPALFRQVRLGRRALPFEMYKFRTMRADADSAPHAHFVRDMILGKMRGDDGVPDERVIFKVHPDPRVTRVGRLLRRTSLDELPQLFNVLRGDMTLVGFRPPIPYEVDSYPAWYHRRFDGKPGITGLWQVSGRNERSYEEMVRLDIEYLNRRSWLFDLLVLVRTVGAVVGGRGAY